MHTNRRVFIQRSALAATALSLSRFCTADDRAGGFTFPDCGKAKPRSRKPGEALNVGVIGVGGKGWVNWWPFVNMGENVVALCDTDRKETARAMEELAQINKAQGVKTYTDYRKMLDECKDLDVVLVSTPDHTHAPAAIRAMKQGCHVYVEKPLVHTVWDANYFRAVAKANGVVTQMGNQGSSDDGFRRNVEVIESGILGDVKEVHVWTNRPIWGGQGRECPQGEDPVPENVDWESWLGTAKARPFKTGIYHRFAWRAFLDFGTGAFGDMACHTMNLPYRALKLKDLASVECTQIEGSNKDTYPSKSVVKMAYAARGNMPAVDLYWYDGNLKPPEAIMPHVTATFGEVPNTGCFIIGDKGVALSENDLGAVAYVGFPGETKMKAIVKGDVFAGIPEHYPRVHGQHYKEFIMACKGEGKCFSDIDFSVPMVEGILLGCIAQQCPGQKLIWDDACKRFANSDKANALLTPHIRAGWEY